jgi:hypothetical protein
MLTLTAAVYNILGGIGVISLLLLPLVMMKMFTFRLFPGVLSCFNYNLDYRPYFNSIFLFQNCLFRQLFFEHL